MIHYKSSKNTPGYNDVGYHNEEVITPNIDKLAKEGIILERNYVQPVCTPTRSSFMTGMYPYRIGRQVKSISSHCRN